MVVDYKCKIYKDTKPINFPDERLLVETSRGFDENHHAPWFYICTNSLFNVSVSDCHAMHDFKILFVYIV